MRFFLLVCSIRLRLFSSLKISEYAWCLQVNLVSARFCWIFPFNVFHSLTQDIVQASHCFILASFPSSLRLHHFSLNKKCFYISTILSWFDMFYLLIFVRNCRRRELFIAFIEFPIQAVLQQQEEEVLYYFPLFPSLVCKTKSNERYTNAFTHLLALLLLLPRQNSHTVF